MSSKSPKIAELIRNCQGNALPAHFLCYFKCFNNQDYYEAHDVLEELWLADGKTGANYAFYKGLIQGAGAFVHLKLNYEFPDHHVHGNRLNPAARLFRRALENTENYKPKHMDLDISHFQNVCRYYLTQLETSDYMQNPWDPKNPPQLELG
ncbi:MAG: DUF309 domain-containing protein [Verrucomicrobiota bacterium]